MGGTYLAISLIFGAVLWKWLLLCETIQ